MNKKFVKIGLSLVILVGAAAVVVPLIVKPRILNVRIVLPLAGLEAGGAPVLLSGLQKGIAQKSQTFSIVPWPEVEVEPVDIGSFGADLKNLKAAPEKKTILLKPKRSVKSDTETLKPDWTLSLDPLGLWLSENTNKINMNESFKDLIALYEDKSVLIVYSGGEPNRYIISIHQLLLKNEISSSLIRYSQLIPMLTDPEKSLKDSQLLLEVSQEQGDHINKRLKAVESERNIVFLTAYGDEVRPASLAENVFQLSLYKLDKDFNDFIHSVGDDQRDMNFLIGNYLGQRLLTDSDKPLQKMMDFSPSLARITATANNPE